jgi:hypothetical protein
MSLSANRSRLAAISKELLVRWQETRNYWHDTKSKEFDQRYLQELFANVDRTVSVLEKLDEVLNKVRKDCE